MKNKSLKINATLNAIKSGLSILFPLITYPYAFRILHAEGVGRVNFANSIVNYFILIAGLGIKTYAIREGAKVRDNKIELEKFTSQVFTINVIATIFSYISFILLINISPRFEGYKDLLLLLSLSIVFTTMEIEWVNTIFEDYLFITIRSIIIHIITLTVLFLFVKTENDVMIYASLTVLTYALISISNWTYCRRYLQLKLTTSIELKKHIRPIMSLFAAAVAINIYVNADTTMLGLYSGDFCVGLYSLGVKVYSVVKRLLAAVYSVTVPRISYYVGQNKTDDIKKVFTKIVSNITILLLPASTGLIVLSREIVICLGGGVQYVDATPALQVLGISLIGAIYGGMVTYCLNIPFGRENENLIATIISSVINVGLNIILIPMWKHVGAAVTTAISEFFVLAFCVLRFKKIKELVDWKGILCSFRNSIIGCVSIVAISAVCHSVISKPIFVLISAVGLSVCVYFFELLALKEELAVGTLKRIQRLGKKL